MNCEVEESLCLSRYFKIVGMLRLAAIRKSELQLRSARQFLRGRSWGRNKLFSATDKVDNLQLIALGQFCFRPQFPADNFAIQFHSHTVLLHAKPLQKGCQRQRSIKLLLLSVDIEFHDQMPEIRPMDFLKAMLQLSSTGTFS